jgi:arginase family enzyme
MHRASSGSRRERSTRSVRVCSLLAFGTPREWLPPSLTPVDASRAGTDGIIKKIRETVGDAPVYLSIDVRLPPLRYFSALMHTPMQIDSIDPAFAPATGTPETGGWSTRELRTILRGLDGLHIVSADIVEVAPAYDTNAELTTMAAADVCAFPVVFFHTEG